MCHLNICLVARIRNLCDGGGFNENYKVHDLCASACFESQLLFDYDDFGQCMPMSTTIFAFFSQTKIGRQRK